MEGDGPLRRKGECDVTPEQKFVEAMQMWRRHGDYIEGCEQCDAIRAACEAFAQEVTEHDCCEEFYPQAEARILRGVFGDD